MLERVDCYMWSWRSPLIPPQITALHQLELGRRSAEVQRLATTFLHVPSAAAAAAPRGAQLQRQPELRCDLSAPLPVYYEEPGGHWGTQAELWQLRCPNCSLPLCAPEHAASPAGGGGVGRGGAASLQLGQLMIFPCGHGCHVQCVTSQACLICAAENMSTLEAPPPRYA